MVLHKLLEVVTPVQSPFAWVERLNVDEYVRRQGTACSSMQQLLRQEYPEDSLIPNHLCAVHDLQADMIRKVMPFDETPRDSYYVSELSKRVPNTHIRFILTYLRGWERYCRLCEQKAPYVTTLWGPFQGHAWCNASIVAESMCGNVPAFLPDLDFWTTLVKVWEDSVFEEGKLLYAIWRRNGVM